MRRIVGDDVDSTELIIELVWKVQKQGFGAYLLHEHDNFGCLHCSAISRNSDHFLNLVLSKHDAALLSLEESVHVEDISGGLYFVVSKSAHALKGLLMAALRHVPLHNSGISNFSSKFVSGANERKVSQYREHLEQIEHRRWNRVQTKLKGWGDKEPWLCLHGETPGRGKRSNRR